LKNFSLSEEQLIELRAAHRSCPVKRGAYRINAIILLGDGWSLEEVKAALLIDQSTLRSYEKIFQKGGVDCLLDDNYQGGESFLTVHQTVILEMHLEENIYLRVQDIIRYVEQEFEIKYSISGMTDLLHNIGFSYKKPKIIPGKADPLAQEEFLIKYEKIKKNKDKDDPIYFMDGVHPQHNVQASYGWIKRGEEREIKSNTGRKRLNINGAIDIENMSCCTVMEESVNAQSTINLLIQIEEKHKKSEKIYIICDNARYYRSRLVNEYLENSKIELIFLPPYAPNLNLIERYWKYFKKKVTYNKYYEEFDDFKNSCASFFEDIKNYENELRSLLTENFQITGNNC